MIVARCVNVLELIEKDRLAIFHAQTLKLYTSLCSSPTTKPCTPFVPTAFFDILISLHHESYVSTVEMSKKEYIVPMTEELEELYSEEMGNRYAENLIDFNPHLI